MFSNTKHVYTLCDLVKSRILKCMTRVFKKDNLNAITDLGLQYSDTVTLMFPAFNNVYHLKTNEILMHEMGSVKFQPRCSILLGFKNPGATAADTPPCAPHNDT